MILNQEDLMKNVKIKKENMIIIKRQFKQELKQKKRMKKKKIEYYIKYLNMLNLLISFMLI